MKRLLIRRIVVVVSLAAVFLANGTARAADLSAKKVILSINRGARFLSGKQNADGSWSSRQGDNHKVGVSSLSLLALINAGKTVDDPPVRKGLKFLRSLALDSESQTYDISLLIMALAAAKDGNRDQAKIASWAQKLESGQIKTGPNAGLWSYHVTQALIDTSGDRSNGQYAVLALRDAAEAGYPVDRPTWERTDRHWRNVQNSDGGWGYSGKANLSPSSGSMTVAGISTLTITNSMLRKADDLNRDGSANCCGDTPPDKNLDMGIRWLGHPRHFAVTHNPPGRRGGSWLLYYLYGLERAGRLSGRRFFGDHDWYREGTEFLIANQSPGTGDWHRGNGLGSDPIVGTSFALLFLSKGLAPVLLNKLKFPTDRGDVDKIESDNWNRHPRDARHLTQYITSLPKWPKLLTWQVVDMNKAARGGGVSDLMQAPVLFLSGELPPTFTEEQVIMLREYIDQGGFIFAVNCCNGEFDAAFRKLVAAMFPDGATKLKPLPSDHPIFISQFPLKGADVRLEGVDFGCRTAIVYSPDDIACLWDKWALQDPPKRTVEAKTMITRATRIGVNVVAYATGRELKNKIDQQEQDLKGGTQDKVERGFLQVAKIRHTGRWDVAPKALRNLLGALNREVGLAASTKQRNLPISDPNIFRYPLLFMHGRGSFGFAKKERGQLKKYLERGGVLFADACCADRKFDRSFRDVMAEMFPDKEFKQIPIEHDLFTEKVMYPIKRVRRRIPTRGGANAALDTQIRSGEPVLEGIEINGRYAVIYSKYDISCALERQASVACAGYIPEDAEKIAINIILYALLQDVARYSEMVR